MKRNIVLLSFLIIIFTSCEQKDVDTSNLEKNAILKDRYDRSTDHIKFKWEGRDPASSREDIIDWDGDINEDGTIDIGDGSNIPSNPIDWDGDINEDGTIDIGDGSNIPSYPIDWDGDINEDGTIDIGDGSNIPSNPIDWDGDIDEDGTLEWGDGSNVPSSIDEDGSIDWDGDINEDGTIDIGDGSNIPSYPIDWDGDINEDGTIDIGDGSNIPSYPIDWDGDINEDGTIDIGDGSNIPSYPIDWDGDINEDGTLEWGDGSNLPPESVETPPPEWLDGDWDNDGTQDWGDGSNIDGDWDNDGTLDWGDGSNIDGDFDEDGTQDWGDGSNIDGDGSVEWGDGDIDGDGTQDWGDGVNIDGDGDIDGDGSIEWGDGSNVGVNIADFVDLRHPGGDGDAHHKYYTGGSIYGEFQPHGDALFVIDEENATLMPDINHPTAQARKNHYGYWFACIRFKPNVSYTYAPGAVGILASSDNVVNDDGITVKALQVDTDPASAPDSVWGYVTATNDITGESVTFVFKAPPLIPDYIADFVDLRHPGGDGDAHHKYYTGGSIYGEFQQYGDALFAIDEENGSLMPDINHPTVQAHKNHYAYWFACIRFKPNVSYTYAPGAVGVRASSDNVVNDDGITVKAVQVNTEPAPTPDSLWGHVTATNNITGRTLTFAFKAPPTVP